MQVQWWITSTEGDLRESATENIPPLLPGGVGVVRVKWCGKSAPRFWQQKWQGKPHWEQDQIGVARACRYAARVGR